MVMDETYVINQLKEDLCFVSTQFTQDMEIARFALFCGFFHGLLNSIELVIHIKHAT